ncbi:hypothetical protein GCM10023063_26110 [Arthrobacter methylotrophus]
MASVSRAAWRVSSQRRWIRASFTSKTSAKSASMLRAITHSASVGEKLRTVICSWIPGSYFAQPLDDQSAVRIPVGAGNAADEKCPIRRLRLRRQGLKRLAINCEPPTGQDSGVLDEETVGVFGVHQSCTSDTRGPY